MSHKSILGIFTLAAAIGMAWSVAATEAMVDPWPYHEDETTGSVQLPPSGPRASGRVVAVDRTAGKITIEYPPIPQLLLEGGTRKFAVQDAALLTSLAPGDKVRFEVEREGRNFVVRRIVNSN
ncbi:MAG: copper-binding protein [Alphaproteobacteria bacterium]|jgi:Cu/Ag efflux protein CusF